MAPKTTAPVLLTGITSFVGTQLALSLVDAGYSVRGTVRSTQKFDKWIAGLPSLRGKVQHVVVEDVAAPGALDKPEVWAGGVEWVAHVASPFHYEIYDPEKDMLQPAIKGTTTLLEAAAKQPSVKRVVITSSFAANLDLKQGYRPGYTYTEADWNPATYDEAAHTDGKTGAAFIYCASKGLAERAAWDFVKEKQPGFALSTILPPLIYGPPQQPVQSLDDLNTSSADIWSLVGGKVKEQGKIPQTGFPVVVDVRDVALAHIRALELDVAKNQRYLVCAGGFMNEQTVRIAEKHHPEIKDRLPSVPADWKAPETFVIDTSKAQKELGISFIPVEKVIDDTITKLLQIEKSVKA